MRRALLLGSFAIAAALAGCNLYFGGHPTPDPYPPDAGWIIPDGNGDCCPDAPPWPDPDDAQPDAHSTCGDDGGGPVPDAQPWPDPPDAQPYPDPPDAGPDPLPPDAGCC